MVANPSTKNSNFGISYLPPMRELQIQVYPKN